MAQQFRQKIGWLGGHRQEADPLVKVAGVPTKQEGEACLATLLRQGIGAQLRQEPDTGGFDLWAPASQEPRARLLLGLSGHSVIRLPRRKPPEKGKR